MDCADFAVPAPAQDAQLIEAGRKEGKLVLYGTIQTDIFELLQKAFQKKTGIAIDYWRTSATKVTERALGACLVASNAADFRAINEFLDFKLICW